jgi:hypothetical protein
VRSARRPLTAGSIARIQFVSHAHMTVVTGAASWRVKNSRQKHRETFISNSPGPGRSIVMSQPAP